GLTFSLNLNGESVDFSTTALVGWDADKVKAKMEEEIATLTEEKMKGENTDLQNVQSNLVLPQILGNSYKLSLSQISWTSSNTDVISIKNGDGYAYPDYVGQVTQPAEDTEVTLTATFKFNKTNSAIEKDIILKKEYKVLVKAKTVDEEQIKKEMLEELNSKYTESLLKDFNTKEVLDVNNVTGDVQLPVPSRIGLVNKEIKVTSSDESLLKINGYRAYTYQPIGEDKKIDLIITMTRDSISVEKRIPLTIKQGSQEEIKNEIKLMEEVKKHYFDGINDGRNIDADNIVQNLHAFKEVSFNEDGTLSWVYNINDATGEGIEPVDIDPSDQMGIGGYRLFYTSNNSVINYENLLVNRPEKDTKVIIKSVLSSKKFAKYAQMYPDNEDLQKLYRQEVQVEVTVKGTKQSNKVTFDDGNSNTENIVKEVNEGDVLDYTPQAPTKEGYTFVGWYLDIDNTTTEYKSGQTYSEDVTYKAKYAHVEMTGAQAKAIVNEKSGIRFGTKLYNDGDEIIEKGTLIIPKNLLANGQKLNLDTKKVAKSVGKNIYESNEEENYVTYLGTLLNIPKSQFGREITAASYVTYKDKAGNEYTVYAPYKNGATTVNNLLGL
ncbi:InlB B-repeat-containing protein, partial [Intestinibacter sp.]